MIPDERRICYLEYRRALKYGILIKQPCEICGAVKTEGHHKDHKKPLDVQWLCRPCHGRIGWTGRKHRPESREKIRLGNLGNKGRTGQKLTLEHRARISTSHMGMAAPWNIERNKNRIWTSEMRAKASESAKRRINPKCSPETRARMSAAQKVRHARKKLQCES